MNDPLTTTALSKENFENFKELHITNNIISLSKFRKYALNDILSSFVVVVMMIFHCF